MHLVLLPDVRHFGADHVNHGGVELAYSHLPAVLYVTEPFGVDAHGLGGDAVGGNAVGGGEGNAGSDWIAAGRAVAFHAFVAVDQGHAPIQPLCGDHHVVMRLADSHVEFALFAP